MVVEEVFKKLEIETDEKREKFHYGYFEKDDEINIEGLGLSTYS